MVSLKRLPDFSFAVPSGDSRTNTLQSVDNFGDGQARGIIKNQMRVIAVVVCLSKC